MHKPYSQWTEEEKEKHRAKVREYTRAHAEENRERVKAWALANPEKVKARSTFEYTKRWKAKNPEAHAAQQHRRYLRHRNGRRFPGGACDLCGMEETAIARHATGGPRALNQDHCHTTGLLRGLLCMDCNRGLGAFKDDPVLLRKAADYIEEWRTK